MLKRQLFDLIIRLGQCQIESIGIRHSTPYTSIGSGGVKSSDTSSQLIYWIQIRINKNVQQVQVQDLLSSSSTTYSISNGTSTKVLSAKRYPKNIECDFIYFKFFQAFCSFLIVKNRLLRLQLDQKNTHCLLITIEFDIRVSAQGPCFFFFSLNVWTEN